jgi:hypothetical protein
MIVVGRSSLSFRLPRGGKQGKWDGFAGSVFRAVGACPNSVAIK